MVNGAARRVDMPKLPNMAGAVLLGDFCNIFGDDVNGAKRVLGGLDERHVDHQWYCPSRSVGRFRMTCEHGHKGQIMKLCQKHYTEFSGGKVTFCPRCNIPPNDHNCKLQMTAVS